MKLYFRLLLVVCSSLVLSTARGQSGHSPMDDVVNDLQNARVVDMVKYFDQYVPVTINNIRFIYSRNQAEQVLRDFLEKNQPRDFLVADNGSPDNSSKFIIGSFVTPANIKYSVYVLMKLKEGNFILQQITLNKE